MQNKYKPQDKYRKEKEKTVVIHLNRNTDSDILSYLETIDNKQGFIKALIRAQMAADGIAAAKEERAAAPAEEDILPAWVD